MVVPTVTTQAAGSITATGATLNGTMVNKQGLAITAEGFEIGTTTGYSLGYFSAGTANLANGATFALAKGSLANFTLYHYRARCTNSTGNGFGGDQTFTTLAVVPTVTFNGQSSFTDSPTSMHCYFYCSANGGQNPTVGNFGTCYVAGAGTPTIANSTNAGSFGAFPGVGVQIDSECSGLTPNTLYTFRAFGTNSAGTGYSATQQRTTMNYYAPVIDIAGDAGIYIVADSPGQLRMDNAWISDDGAGGLGVNDVGLVWALTSVNSNPTVGGTGCTKVQYATSNPGFFDQIISGLANDTSYMIRAYAKNAGGTYGYSVAREGNTQTVTPTAVVYAVSSDNHSITVYVMCTDNGGQALGKTVGSNTFYLGYSLDPLTNQTTLTADYWNDYGSDPGVGVPVGWGNYGLPLGTTYYARAFAYNLAAGGYYSGDTAIATTSTVASCTTNAAASITPTQAVLAGTVDNTYGSSIIESGVVYSTSVNPTTANTKIGVGTSSAPSGTVSGLIPKTMYHCRAYCITDAGTGYGADQTFTTLSRVKKFNGINYSSIKTFNGKPIAQVKSIQSVQ